VKAVCSSETWPVLCPRRGNTGISTRNSVEIVTVFVYLDKSRCDEGSRDLPEKLGQKYLVSYPLGEGGFGEVSLIFEKVKYVAKMVSILKEI
jgi:hypothetical protein